jgi:hypothetical protein
MSSRALSPRAFQAVVLALLVAGLGLIVFQQRRIGALEAKLVASVSAAGAPASPPPARVPREAQRFEPVPSAAPGTVVMSGLTKEEAFAMTERLRLPTPPPTVNVDVPAFLAEHRIGPAVWKKVQAVNERASEALHALNRTFPSGSVEESEARIAKLESERKAAVSQLLTPEQAKAYEAMRSTGQIEGFIRLADGAVTRWVYQY